MKSPNNDGGSSITESSGLFGGRKLFGGGRGGRGGDDGRGSESNIYSTEVGGGGGLASTVIDLEDMGGMIGGVGDEDDLKLRPTLEKITEEYDDDVDDV